ncbi:MAG: FAD synthetase family protein [Clostridia bacterium]|nr:FAD synthetase family protein [Clostridia bacterium]
MEVLYNPNFSIKSETVVAFGKFDGLHKGHLKIINTLVDEAHKLHKKACIYTFLNNPKAYLNNEDITVLMTNEEKVEALENLSIDILIFQKFDRDFANIMPEDFVKNVLVDQLHVKEIVIGSNSTFGKDSLGNVTLLKELSKKYDFDVIEIPLLKENGKVISSTEIRKSLALKGGK